MNDTPDFRFWACGAQLPARPKRYPGGVRHYEVPGISTDAGFT